ncbi:hypothetical protein H6G89_32185 [Oscillatoria sp. FACHB-1407]|uniref:hypothetical protein n=1 Tax=Oscillatoria sp. FACHB-1407 TaxID=2692847 RepID=UPI001684AFD2|nr:hypothetical protein [Oscillatoria sp. FACHB-1407]MBD2465652.1 hypothetical protein [Oscillatoria sp. FACHB-1407]
MGIQEHSAFFNDNQNDNQDDQHQEQSEANKTAPDSPQIVDPLDLVYSGGFTGDPQEILGNPAVAPEMLSEGRDLRVDIFRDTEEATPD